MLSAYDFHVFPAASKLRTTFGTFWTVEKPSLFEMIWPVAISK